MSAGAAARAPPDPGAPAARRSPVQHRRSPAHGRARSWSSREVVSIPALGEPVVTGGAGASRQLGREGGSYWAIATPWRGGGLGGSGGGAAAGGGGVDNSPGTR